MLNHLLIGLCMGLILVQVASALYLPTNGGIETDQGGFFVISYIPLTEIDGSTPPEESEEQPALFFVSDGFTFDTSNQFIIINAILGRLTGEGNETTPIGTDDDDDDVIFKVLLSEEDYKILQQIQTIRWS